MKKNKIVTMILLFNLVLSSAFAGIGDFFSGKEGIFTLDPLYDGLIGGTGLALTGGAFIWDKLQEPPTFSGETLNQNNINSFDKWAIRPYSKPLHITGTITEALAMAVPMALFATNTSEWGVWAVMYAESMLFANGIKEIIKNSVKRERPYMYFENRPQNKIDDGDYIRSFPSGHATMAFNGAVFASYVFSEYFPDSPWKIPVIAGSLTLATATAVQRILSGNHFITDVLTGAAIGSLTGFLIPFLHTLPKNDKIEPVVSPTGFMVRFRF